MCFVSWLFSIREKKLESMYNDEKGGGDFQRQSDDDFWNESQIGHNFEETVSLIEYISI